MIRDRYYAADIARLADCHPQTIRKFADLGLIPSRRDYKGWPVFTEPQQVANLVRQLLTGQFISQDEVMQEVVD